MPRRRKAAALGCGPAGMFAAHAIKEAGWDLIIFSVKRRSEMFGAQYLHLPIPGLPEKRTEISYRLQGGPPSAYRAKVYGPDATDYDIPVSPEVIQPVSDAYDIRAAYYEAYEMYSSYVYPVKLAWPTVQDIVRKADFDLVVSSIPAPKLCGNTSHKFLQRSVWAIGDAPERGVYAPDVGCPGNTVVCDASRHRAWYRASNIFGYNTVEWPNVRLDAGLPPTPNVAEMGGALVMKPISHNCTCWDRYPKLQPVGRYGTWRKGTLSHEAYFLTREFCKTVERGY